jgi:CubicO group peptidase (beta-lactamase class C family)
MIRAALSILLSITASSSLVACDSADGNRGNETASSFNPTPIDSALSTLVSEGSLIGASGLIYLEGEEVYYGEAGLADREVARDWDRDTLIAIYSMTKPVTGVTLMSLYEEGLFELDAPLSDYLPEYADVRVLTGLDADGAPILKVPDRPIQVIDIFRHTACFGYGWEGLPASEIMNAANILDPDKPLAQMSLDLAGVPLFCEPGSEWRYSVAVDVQARLAEVLTGQDFEDVMRARVLDPLGMTETRYFVPTAEKNRVAAAYRASGEGGLDRLPVDEVYSLRATKPAQIGGGSGLISSIDDYMRFALMLRNEGELDGVRILRPDTIALMSRDHLPDSVGPRDFLPSKGQMGFGLDFAVRVAPPIDDQEPFGVVGEFFWDGAASPLFWVDPQNDLTAVFFTQKRPFDREAHKRFRRAVYEAVGVIEDTKD